MTAWTLIVTHLLAAVAGGGLTYAGVVCWGEWKQGSEGTVPNRRLRARTWVGIVVLIASGMVISIGVAAYMQQANVKQQRQEDRDRVRAYSECITAWGGKLVDTINERNDDRAAYDAAQQARDDSLVRVAKVLIRLRRIPPKATDGDVGAALAKVAEADRVVAAAARRLEAERPTYQTPTLVCGEVP